MLQPIDRDGEQSDIIPVADLLEPVLHLRSNRRDGGAQALKALPLHLFVAALRYHQRTLPVIAAIDHHEDSARRDAAQWFRTVVRPPREAQPQHIDGSANILDNEAAGPANRRVPAVGTDNEIGDDCEGAGGSPRPKAGDASVLFNEFGRLALHAKRKGWIALGVTGDEIEKIPLRHQHDELASGRQVREIGDRHSLIADDPAQPARFLMGPGEKLGKKPELMNDFEGRGMDRVAAKVAEEIGVFLENDDVDAGPCQEKAEHHAGRAAAGNTALRSDDF